MAQKWRAFKNISRFFKNPFAYLYWKVQPLIQQNRIRFIWLLLIFHLYQSFLLWIMIKNSRYPRVLICREGTHDRTLALPSRRNQQDTWPAAQRPPLPRRQKEKLCPLLQLPSDPQKQTTQHDLDQLVVPRSELQEVLRNEKAPRDQTRALWFLSRADLCRRREEELGTLSEESFTHCCLMLYIAFI